MGNRFPIIGHVEGLNWEEVVKFFSKFTHTLSINCQFVSKKVEFYIIHSTLSQRYNILTLRDVLFQDVILWIMLSKAIKAAVKFSQFH